MNDFDGRTVLERLDFGVIQEASERVSIVDDQRTRRGDVRLPVVRVVVAVIDVRVAIALLEIEMIPQMCTHMTRIVSNLKSNDLVNHI